MRKLESYAENPFDNIKASREDIAAFYTDHKNRLIQAVANGEPFNQLVGPTTAACNNLVASQSSTVLSKTDLKSMTMDVDQVKDLFVERSRYYESIVLAKFDKNSSAYNRFYPNGLTGYNTTKKSNILALFDQMISAATIYKADIGETMFAEFSNMKDQYIAARDSQQQQKETKTGSAGTWDSNLELMSNQAFDNLLSICHEHKNHPELIKQYFDVRMIKYVKHAGDEESGAYVLAVPHQEKRCADLSFGLSDVFSVMVTTDKLLQVYGALAADSPIPAILIDLPAGEEVEITGAMLGAPANRFFIVVNKDETTDGEVEIVLLK